MESKGGELRKRIANEVVARVSARLRKMREGLKLDGVQLARRLGVSASAYLRNEGGINLPTIETLSSIQEEFGISLDWLITGKGPMYFKDKETAQREAEIIEEDEKFLSMPDYRQFWERFKHDPLLRHEVLANFYKYMDQRGPRNYESTAPAPEEEKAGQ